MFGSDFDILKKDFGSFEPDNKDDKPTILVIDDDKELRESIRVALGNKFNIILCSSGDEGIKKVNEKVSVVILDIKMDKKDGFETFLEIKEKFTHLPIIFHSAYQNLKDPYKIMNNYRPFGYITKAGNYNELVDTINSALQHYSQLQKNEILVKELKELNKTLEEKVKERTKEVLEKIKEIEKTNEELEQEVQERIKAEETIKKYNKELQLLNANKDKFFSIIAHDLKNPFNSLLGFSEYMSKYLEELTPDEIKEYSHNMYTSAQRVFALLENLLQWSRHQTGKILYEPINFDISVLAKEVVELYSYNAKEKGINLEMKIETGTNVLADKDMLHAVLRNLFSNAIKYNQSGGKVEIYSEDKGDFYEIIVDDDGIGMDENELNKIFRIDVHFTKKGTSDEKGTGLGLILCKEFVVQNGGKIWVNSKAEKGTAFHFTLNKAK